MATKKESESEELVHYRHPDGHWQEMTKAEAAALEKKDAKKSEEDWQAQIKTRSE